MDNTTIKKAQSPTNRSLLLPYVAPYFAYVAVATLSQGYLSRELSYLIRIILVAPLLFWAWPRYASLKGPSSTLGSIVVGAVTGSVAIGAWILLLLPFSSHADSGWTLPAFCLRLFAAGLLVPVFEELLMRGFVLRLAFQWDMNRRSGSADPFGAALDQMSINDVKPGSWTPLSVALSTAVFAAGHSVNEWPAAIVFGLFMSVLWIYRRDLISCVVAHATANILLGIYVLKSGQWGLW